ncbi:MAG: hypothetical protein AB7V50_02390 [Vampirovibrionia bacterium]
MLSGLVKSAAVYAHNNPAPFLRYTAAGTYTLSTAMQAVGIAQNKEIPQKEKSFLIPQELFNGALQLVTFLTVATTLENWGRKLAQEGKILAQKGLPNTPKFVNGVAVAFSLAGTILAFNIITPILRNPITYFVQKKKNKQLSVEEQFLTRPIIPAINLSDRVEYNRSNPFMTFEARSNVPFRSNNKKFDLNG